MVTDGEAGLDMALMWAYDVAPVEGSVTTLVKDLRRRLKAAGVKPDPIETVYGLGYRLKPNPRATPASAWGEQIDPKPDSVLPASSTAQSSSAQRVNEVVQQVDSKFRASWAERLEALEVAANTLQTGEYIRQQQDALASVHKLVGGLGTFGYDKAAAVAETLEESVRQHLEQEAQWTRRFSELLEQLQRELAQAAESSSADCADTGKAQKE